ncbi:hypothetical protein BCV69DRAFT_111052 [Microstroma glucosiphilum]|uniref:Uncharacterized protein n=1 Tax=Pseudomicrostroma glucosiphilum TaxID=1684307 RepID=A0A316UFI6_9BASI|nr:hypothetical protein BCV69DRAFT_111052 [Pseudomicrostroma glucosiphilum]PWN23171.1 hypothetical protein BCV69DRAFT_111052 [Pseudomicrostroma glucosiphilum]
MALDIASAIEFNRQLTCVAMCALTSSLWDEAHPLDLATMVVAYMSEAAIKYLFGSGDASQVEAAKSHQSAGVYSLVQSFDAERCGVDVGKSNVSVSKRINAHRAAVAKSKQSTLYQALKAFQGRPFYEILLVGFPVSDPDWFRRLWTRLCPITAASWEQPLDSGDIRETFTSLVEASFIALRQSFPKNEQYTEERTAIFGALAGVKGLNETPGTEDTVNKSRGGRQFYAGAGLHPAVDRLQSHLTNEVRGKAGGLPQPKLKSHKYTSKKKDLTLNGYLRTCQARMFQQLLRVAVRSAAPDWFRKLWQDLCQQNGPSLQPQPSSDPPL